MTSPDKPSFPPPAGDSGTAPRGAWEKAPPFKFLDYFGESEAASFHGRKREVAELSSIIASERTVVLYGKSGVGKTSILLAGVFPELRARGFFPVHARLLQSPLRDLIDAVARASGEPAGESLADVLQRAAARRGPLVVVLDQLEELFVRFPKAEDRAPLLAEISAALANAAVRVRFVFSLRQDYMAELDDLEGPLSDLLDRRYRLKGLTSAAAREAISLPLYDADIEFSQRLLNRLVDMLKVDNFDPPVLQIVCSELWRQAIHDHPERRELDEKDLDDTGGREIIFRRYLNRAIASVPESDHFALRGILSGLVTSQGTKKATTIRQLGEKERFRAGACEIRRVLKRLVQANVVRQEMRGKERWFELIHERLVDIVEPWLAEDPRFFSFRFASDLIERLAQNPVWREEPNALIAAPQLEALIGPIKERLRLGTEDERELLLRSVLLARSADIPFWAGVFTMERTRELILSLLSLLPPLDPEVRRTALLAMTKLWRTAPPAGVIVRPSSAAASELPAPDSELLEACLDVALADVDPRASSTAASTFAAFGDPKATGPLQATLLAGAENDEDLHAAALAVLLAWIRSGRETKGLFLPEDIAEALQMHEERALETGREELDRQSRSARSLGLRSAAIWCCGVGLLVWAAGAIVIDPWHYKDTAYLLAGAIAALAVICGAVVTPFAARRVQRASLLEKRMSWSRVFRAPRFLLAAGIPLLLAEIYAWNGPAAGGVGPSPWSVLGAVLFAVLGMVILGVVAWLGEHGRRDPKDRVHATLVVPMASVGLAVITTMFGVPLAVVAGRPLAAHTGGWVIAVLASAVAATAVRGLVLQSRGPKESSWWARPTATSLAVCALSVLAIHGVVTGSPLWAPTIPVASHPPSTSNVDLDNPMLPVRWRRLVNPVERYMVVEADPKDAWIQAERFRLTWDRFDILVPPGAFPLAIAAGSAPAAASLTTGAPGEEPLEMHTCWSTSGRGCVLRQEKLKFDAGQTWTGSIEVHEEDQAQPVLDRMGLHAVLVRTKAGYVTPYFDLSRDTTSEGPTSEHADVVLYNSGEDAPQLGILDDYTRIVRVRPDRARPWTVTFDVRVADSPLAAAWSAEGVDMWIVTLLRATD